MSTLKPPKKISRRQELRKDTLTTLYAKSWGFFDQNRQIVWGAGIALVVAVIALIAFLFYQNSQQATAQALLSSSIRYFESGDYRTALDGTDDVMGLLAIADDYGSTDAGNLAHFYAADALFRLGEMDEALEHFEDFDKGANFIGASAYAGEAAIHEAQGRFDDAGDSYLRAASVFESDVASPGYLLKAGRAYEQAGDYRAAERAYQSLQDDFPNAQAAANVEFYLARVAALQRKQS